ncbi:BlaR1 peptidase M56 [Arachidicoccus rhizosphaerae]|uniref:BlaR1 peptidase M56 n=1 Tax=Arachidicoccus rhizosphaerae TaxID=551991 RepID=A0A1H3VJP6_9BACT|nr:M56 family metallopeptidase [Arachidicoccus rhizosphaerae]SDZ74368.1 BlaR1 peptidase M56 [Arachidicoccus rhizosphaerae]
METLFNWLSSPAFKALGMSLLSSLWQAAILYFLTYALIWLNRNSAARIKYNLAAVGSLIATIWFIQTFIYYLNLETSLSGQIKEQSAALFYFPGNFPVLTTVYPGAATETGFHLSKCIPLALIIYFIGVTILLFKVLFSYLQTRQLKTSGLFTAPVQYMQHLAATSKQFNIASRVQLYLSDKINTPLMMGYLKPIILLPVSIITHLSAVQIEAIITHELAHIRRQDYLVNFIMSIVEALFFFNPFIWLLSKIMREEREKACDELVIKSVAPYTYATALLALEKINETKRLTLAANGHNSFKLLNRIKLFTMKKNPIISVKQKIVSLLLIIMAIGCIAWLSPKQQQAKNKQITATKEGMKAQKQITATNSARTNPQIIQPKQPASHYLSSAGSRTVMDSITPQMQQQIDEITKSAQKIAAGFAADTAWQSNLAAIQQKAMQITSKFEQDPAFKATIEKITQDAKALSSKMKDDPALEKQLRDLDQNAQQMAEAYKPSPEMQKQLEALSNRSAAIAASFAKDTAWKNQIKHLKFRAEKLARQLKDNPEMQEKIKKMADTYKDMAIKVLNDPKFKNQLQQLHDDLSHMNWDLDNDD